MAYRPKEIADQLGVSSATLRRWSDTFSDYLSPSAGRSVSENGGSTQRRYTDQDVLVLQRAKVLLDAGNTYDEVLSKMLRNVFDTTEQRVVAADNNAIQPLTQPLMSDSLIAVEQYREVLVAKDQVIAYQQQLIEELRKRPPTVTLPSLTWRQRLDWLVRGRMLAVENDYAPAESATGLSPD